MAVKYYSAEAYAKKVGLGPAEVKKMIARGELKAIKTDGGHYKIAEYTDEVPIEEFIKVKEENVKLKTIIQTIANNTKQVFI